MLPYIVQETGAFIFHKKNFLSSGIGFFSIQFSNDSPYKLHISLYIDDYKQHEETLKQILNSYLEKNIIEVYKYIKADSIKQDIQDMNAILELIPEIKSAVTRNESLKAYYLFSQTNLIKRHPSRINTFSSISEVEGFQKQIETKIKEAQRLIDSDQFTIYIPAPFKNADIAQMCKDIDEYLTSCHAKPGKLYESESPIGNYLNLRQEYLLEDYNRFNQTGKYDKSKRIEAINLNDNCFEIEKRKKVKKEQDESELYQYIAKNLNSNPDAKQSIHL